VPFHTEDEKALIETFRAQGGKRIIFFRRGEPKLSKPMTKALARLVRSGHIVIDTSGDFGWIRYQLRDTMNDEIP
jgi:hypothetical protein